MKTIKEIQKEVTKCAKMNKREELATCYLLKLREQIGDSQAKLVVYKDACNDKVDLDLPMFWMSTGAALCALISAIIATVGLQKPEISYISIYGALFGIVTILVMFVVYYKIVYNNRKKYSLIAVALEQIEIEMNK